MSPLQTLILVLAITVYWAPTMVAVLRHAPHFGSVLVVNLFLGWTLVGWVVALAMACRSRFLPVTYVPGSGRP
jgi:hypothetical protein